MRKETVERVFADAKEKHAMRYTNFRGLAQVTNWVRLKFAAMNLKKFAVKKWKQAAKNETISFFFRICLWQENPSIFFKNLPPIFFNWGFLYRLKHLAIVQGACFF